MLFKLNTILSLCVVFAANISNVLGGSSTSNSTQATFPFAFTHLFTATLTLGTRSKPITIPGGFLINEPIVSGKVSGPSINATILGGFAHPSLYNLTLQVPSIDIYGMTDDEVPFYIHEVGVGSNSAQVTRIEINIGSGNSTKYQVLNDGYILASVNPDANGTLVMVQGYLARNVL